MQIKDNITATSNPKGATLKSPIKMVKLRSKDIVSKNSDKLMEPTWEIETKSNEVPEENVQNAVSESEGIKENEVSTESSVKPEEETKETESRLPLTSEDVIKSKKDTLGIEAYTDIESNNVNLESYQNARRLRVNEVVVGNANRERNINGVERVKQQEETPNTQEQTNNTFDFGELGSMNNENNTSMEAEIEEEPKYDNVTKLDEWLNKETAPVNINSGDKVLNEVNELQTKLNDTKSSLATQKEILESLRAHFANNETLVQAKKQEMEEENINATRELSDILAQITLLKNKISEQEAFLGISNDEETLGRNRAA